MKKIKWIVSGVVIFLAIIVAIRFFGSPEDVWICEGGQWKKHGNPSVPAPGSGCGASVIGGLEQKSERPMQEPDQSGPEVKNENLNIKISSPLPGAAIKSPMEISGSARGWFFEGVFPVKLIDEKNNILAEGQAEARSDWTADAFVPFSLTLKFDPGTAEKGYLILQKDNPSGLPKNDEKFSVPVSFK